MKHLHALLADLNGRSMARLAGILALLPWLALAGPDAQALTIRIPGTPPAPPAPQPDRAIAAPFWRLPDGRIGVEIFGQKIGLPATPSDSDRDLDRIEFYPLRAQPFGERHTTFTLRDALAEPDKARLAFEQEPEWISVRILSWPENASVVLGGFDRRVLPQDGLHVHIERRPDPGPPRQKALPHHWPAEATSPDEDGYFVRPGVVPPRRKKPDEVGYRLPASQRLWATGVDLIVICRWVGAAVRECSSGQQTPDGRISIGWSWFEDAFPKPRWKELDLRLHKFADYLLLNKPSGEPE